MAPLAPVRPRRGPVPRETAPSEPTVPDLGPREPVVVGRMTEAEYLAFIRGPGELDDNQYELLAGGIVRQMPNVRRPHSLLSTKLASLVDRFLDQDRFEVHSEGLKFRPRACRIYCPDTMVTPSPPRLFQSVGDVTEEAIFVAEMLSDSTEHTDRGEKLDCYRGTPSVLEYWLVHQDAVRVERHHRDPGGAWPEEPTVYEDRADKIPLPALGGAVKLADLYRQAVPPG